MSRYLLSKSQALILFGRLLSKYEGKDSGFYADESLLKRRLSTNYCNRNNWKYMSICMFGVQYNHSGDLILAPRHNYDDRVKANNDQFLYKMSLKVRVDEPISIGAERLGNIFHYLGQKLFQPQLLSTHSTLTIYTPSISNTIWSCRLFYYDNRQNERRCSKKMALYINSFNEAAVEEGDAFVDPILGDCFYIDVITRRLGKLTRHGDGNSYSIVFDKTEIYDYNNFGLRPPICKVIDKSEKVRIDFIAVGVGCISGVYSCLGERPVALLFTAIKIDEETSLEGFSYEDQSNLEALSYNRHAKSCFPDYNRFSNLHQKIRNYINLPRIFRL